MKIYEALLQAHHKLKTARIPLPWLDAELLLAFILQKPRSYLTAHASDPLCPTARQQLSEMTRQRCGGKPLAYITGEKEFCGLAFAVTPAVLIPRPATEELVEYIINSCRGVLQYAPTIIDVGTGSGCIAITLAKHIPDSHIIATDISPQALQIARQNAQRHKVEGKITFLHGDLLAPIFAARTGKLKNRRVAIAANLPYVPAKTILTKSELSYEPKTALDGGKDGTLVYRRLLNQITGIIDQWAPSIIVCETDQTILPALKNSPEFRTIQTYYRVREYSAFMALQLMPLPNN